MGLISIHMYTPNTLQRIRLLRAFSLCCRIKSSRLAVLFVSLIEDIKACNRKSKEWLRAHTHNLIARKRRENRCFSLPWIRLRIAISFREGYQMIARRMLHSCGSREKKVFINNVTSTVSRDFQVFRTILNNTEPTRNHMTPEIQLFLLTPNCPLYHEPFQKILEDTETKRNVFTEPFWSIYWPGGQGLARFVLDEGNALFSSFKNVLDFGAGCGATAIAAKLRGASRVVANDIDKVACTAIMMNALANNVELKVSQENLLHRSPDKLTDFIFIGDMLYDQEIASVLIPWLEGASKNGTRIFIGDPGRHGLTEDLRKRLTLLKCYSLPENVRKENYGYDKCYVWEFSK